MNVRQYIFSHDSRKTVVRQTQNIDTTKHFASRWQVDATMLEISQECLATTPDDPRFAQTICRVVVEMHRGFIAGLKFSDGLGNEV